MSCFQNEKTLETFCQNNTFFKIKFALVTLFNVRYSKIFEKSLLVIEYLQLISQVLLLHPILFDTIDQDLRNSFLFQVVVYFFKLLNPSYLLNFTKEDPHIVPVLCLVTAFAVIKTLLPLYIIYVASQREKDSSWLVNLWRWIFRMQGRILYYFVSSFWVRGIIAISKGEFEVGALPNYIVVVFFVLFMLIGYFSSMFLEIQFQDALSSKNFLDGKNSNMQILTLSQKFVLQIIQLSFRFSDLKAYWFSSIFGLIFCFIRGIKFFRTLPLYHYGALRLQVALMSLVFSLNLAYVMEVLLKTTGFLEIHMNNIIVLWVVLAVLFLMIGLQLLDREYMNLLTRRQRGCPEKMLHKIRATKELLAKYRIQTKKNKKLKWTNLLCEAENKNLERVFGLDLELITEKKYNIKEDEDASEVFLEYLKSLLAIDPESSIVKLHLAKIYAKKYRLYSEVIKLVSDIQKTKHSPYCISAAFLLHRVEENIMKNSDNNDDRKLDLVKYINSHLLVEDLVNQIIKQIELTMEVCKNVVHNKSDIGLIYNNGLMIYDQKKGIEKKIEKVLKEIPDYFLRPVLISSMYDLLLNFSLVGHQKYYESYLRKGTAFERPFTEHDLMEENLYQSSNVFLILAADSADYCRIMYCTKSVQDIFGDNISLYQNKLITDLFIPSLKGYYDNLFKQIFEKGQIHTANRVIRSYLQHRSGYIIEADIYIRIHPYVTQDLYLDMVIRPVPTKQQYILVKEEGDIVGMTKGMIKFREKHTNRNTTFNLRVLSKELSNLNLAYNAINKFSTQNELNFGAGTEEELRHQNSINTFNSPLRMFGAAGGGSDLNRFNTSPEIKEIKKNPTSPSSLFRQVSFPQNFDYDFIIDNNQKSSSSNNNNLLPTLSPFHRFAHTTQSLQMDNFKAANLCHQYLREKKEIQLDFVRETAGSKGQANDVVVSETLYTCQIDPLSYGTLNFNLLKLDEISHFDEVVPAAAKLIEKKKTVVVLEKEKFKQQLDDISEIKSEDFLECDEGVLNSEPITTRGMMNEVNLFTSVTQRTQTEEPLLTGPRTPKKSHGVAATVNTNTNTRTKTQTDKSSIKMRVVPRKEKPRDLYKKAFPSSIKAYLSTGASSETSQVNEVRRIFGQAVSIKSTPKFVHYLYCLCYGAILISLFSQIAIKIVLDETTSDLWHKRALLNNAQYRTYFMARIQVSARGGTQQYEGSVTPAQLGIRATQLKGNVVNMNNIMRNLTRANEMIYDGGKYLNQDISNAMYERNIQMTDFLGQPLLDENFTSFEVVNLVQNAMAALNTLQNVSSQQGYNLFRYLVINTLNDFLWNNAQIVDVFLGSVDHQKKVLESITLLFIIIAPIWLFITIKVLGMIVWKQYKIEKKLLLEFITLHEISVSDLYENIKSFREKLMTEEALDEGFSADFVGKLKGDEQGGNLSHSQAKNEHRVVDYIKVKNRYYDYILKIVLFCMIMVAIILGSYFYVSTATKKIYRMQDQLQFANQLSSNTTLAYIAYIETFVSNNTNYISHKDPLTVMENGIVNLKKIEDEMLDKFKELDGTYNDDVAFILFNNASCSKLMGEPQERCGTLHGMNRSSALAEIIPSFRQGIIQKLEDYELADKSNQTELTAVCIIGIQPILAEWSGAAALGNVLNEIITDHLAAYIDETSHDCSIILVGYCLSLFVVGLQIWFQILSKVSQVNNSLKKVLSVFPPNLILSNVELERFLNQTSNNIFKLKI